jgi:hypothetical protein
MEGKNFSQIPGNGGEKPTGTGMSGNGGKNPNVRKWKEKNKYQVMEGKNRGEETNVR